MTQDIIKSCYDCEFQPVCRKQHNTEKAQRCNMIGQSVSSRTKQAVIAVKKLYEKQHVSGFNVSVHMHYAYDTPNFHNYDAENNKLLIVYKTDKIRKTIGIFVNNMYYFDDDLYLREIPNVIGYMII